MDRALRFPVLLGFVVVVVVVVVVAVSYTHLPSPRDVHKSRMPSSA